MRRLPAVIISACLLTLVLAAPALAAPNSNNDFGQTVKTHATEHGADWGAWVSDHASMYAGEFIPYAVREINAGRPVCIPGYGCMYFNSTGELVAFLKSLLPGITLP